MSEVLVYNKLFVPSFKFVSSNQMSWDKGGFVLDDNDEIASYTLTSGASVITVTLTRDANGNLTKKKLTGAIPSGMQNTENFTYDDNDLPNSTYALEA